MSRSRGYLPTLDGWRAIAIMLVMIAHVANGLWLSVEPQPDPLWFRLTRYGAKGVDLFFGISGFLICSRLLEEHETRGRISLRGFYIRRFARILPPYYAFLVVVTVIGLAGLIHTNGGQLLTSLLFVRNYYAIGHDAGWYTWHLWSLAVEEHFYLLWPGLLVLWSPARARSRVVVLALAVAAWRVVEFRLRLLEHVLPGISFYFRTDIRLDALLWGCWMALLLRGPAWRDRVTAMLRGSGWIAAVMALIAVIAFSPPLALLWQSILIPVVLAGTTLNPDTPIGRLLEAAPLRWIGRISYSLYLWQEVFLVPTGERGQLGLTQSLPFNIACTFAVAAASYYLIERPMIKLGHRLAPPTTEGRV